MSQQDLQAVLDRSRHESSFATEMFVDLPGTLKKYNYSLTADELQQLNQSTNTASHAATRMDSSRPDAVPPVQPDAAAAPARAQDNKLRECVQDAVQTTFRHAAGTYQRITLMNQVLFWMGVSLFLFAVIYAVWTHNLIFTIAFAGLGTVSFIGVFILGPIGKTQAALSNLISAEIAFLSYMEQVWLIERFALLPCNALTPWPDAERMARASELLQNRSNETTDLLHRYLDKAFELQKTELKHRLRKVRNEVGEDAQGI